MPGTVAPPTGNGNPTAFDVAVSAVEDGGAVDGAFDATDPDPGDQDKLAFVILSPPAEGIVSNNGDGTFTFSPGSAFQDLSEGETRDVTFAYRAIDSHGAVSNQATVTVTVAGKNDAPAAADLSATVAEGAATGPIPFPGTDPDDDPASLVHSIVQPPSLGTVTLNSDGTFSFDTGTDFDFLVEGQTLDVTFTYQATDPHGAISNQATVTMTVIGANVVPDSDECPVPPPSVLAGYDYSAGSGGADTIDRSGSDGNQWIQGFAGDDVLTGAGLDDLIEGGEGNDTIDGGDGADILLAGAGADTISGGEDADCIDAGAGNDTIDGGNSNDHLHGDDGDDVLLGGNAEDTLEGGAGNDQLFGGNGQDTVSGNDGDDTIDGGNGEDTLDGGAGNDNINGGSGDDTITGGGGNDIVEGGNGKDTIDGQPGNLIIRFSSILDAGDVIINFDANPDGGQDVIDLDPLFDSLEATLGPLSTSSRSNLLQLTFSSGVAEIFIDDDKDSATAPILLATVSTSEPVVIGSTLIIDLP
jgi:VCBS repeat-containing protein